ncbi:MAG: murein biosynthesis integral membrane protein MurJ [Anaerolineae bacterium]|nr:murein biosynthesis integral membrane protein MurJ [Anaerolineae bacterium]MDQ7036905.1 murein biosynthesis integral membrane protein MurJ [Anaerolineae bacterium]
MPVDSTALPDDPHTLTPDAAAEQEATNASVASATGILALGNVASRILGLVREKALAFFFGASASMDAFRLAVIIPQTFYDLLIGGHVNGAIVPVFSEIVTLKGRDELWKVVNILFSMLLVIVSAIVIIIQIFAPYLVQLTGSGYDAQTLALATQLLRLTSPALIFLALFAIFSGTLYAINNFTWPAFAGVLFNASIVLTTFLLVPPMQVIPRSDINYLSPVMLGRPDNAVMAAAIGWTLGAIVQMSLQMVGLRMSHLRFTINWKHPALRRIALLYAPVMFSLMMDTVVIRFFSYNLASKTGIEGGLQYMNLATTLIQFPQGLVATAISIAVLPTLAAQAALVKGAGLRAYRDTLGLGLRLTITLIIPAALGLFVLAHPITQLLFEGGEFLAADTVITVRALRLYLLGLPFAALDLLLVYAFYARKDTLTPALIGVFSHVVYIVTVLLLFDRFNLFSLMIADSVKHMVHATISAIFLWRHLHGFGKQRLLLTASKTIAAAGIMGLVGWQTLPFLNRVIGSANTLQQALLVLIATALSGAIFIILAVLLRLEELYWLAGLIRKKIGR